MEKSRKQSKQRAEWQFQKKHLFNLKVNLGARETERGLTAPAAPTEDLDLVPNTYMITTIGNSRPRRSETLFWSL